MIDFGRESPARLSRRSVLAGAAAVSSAPILAASVTPAKAKISQVAAGYQNAPKNGQNCASCNLFLPPSACKTVGGPVSANGWCRIWVQKAA